MATQRASGNPEHVLRVTSWVAGVLSIVAIIAGVATHHADWGVAAAAGLLIGAANIVATDKMFGSGIPFFATSGIRIVVLTMTAFAVYFIFHGHIAIAYVVGLSLAQMSLSISAVVEAVR